MFKGKKTVIWSAIIGTLGVIETTDLSFIGPEYSGPILIAVSIVNVWLRALTTTAIGHRE